MPQGTIDVRYMKRTAAELNQLRNIWPLRTTDPNDLQVIMYGPNYEDSLEFWWVQVFFHGSESPNRAASTIFHHFICFLS
jgi:hypothetical protein